MLLEFVWLSLGGALIIYVLTGCADFGGGILHLLATGARKDDQRNLIDHVIAPIWEANHVWLIFIIVVMFTVFPKAFSAITTALHIPITIVLVGIVLRGAAFSFRAYGLYDNLGKARWGNVFAVSSLFTPWTLGMIVAALCSGEIHVRNGTLTSGFFAGWLSPLAWSMGLLVATLSAFLASVYLTVEAHDGLADEFRTRALLLQGVLLLSGILVLVVSSNTSPYLWSRFVTQPWGVPVLTTGFLLVLATFKAMYACWFHSARVLAVAQAALIVVGWGLAMNKHLIIPHIGIRDAGASHAVLVSIVPAIIVGTAFLLPALSYLFFVFKKRDV